VSAIDDSFLNTKAAAALGWNAVHLVEPSEPTPPEQAAQHQVWSLHELRDIFPQFFKPQEDKQVNGS
jgi:pyrimidine and pyridine-specific 5'-nucleotidase